MTCEPAVSIIIPTYNRSALLCEAIQSVLAQTCRDFEVIVVDDGSTDDTRQVVAGFGPPVRYVYQDNRGRSAARNRGLREARGRYLLFLDSDDLLLPSSLEMLSACFDAHRGAGAVHSGCQYCDANAKPVHQVPTEGQPSAPFLDRLALANVVGAIHSVLVRREWLDRVDEHLVICEDQDLWLRLAAMGCEFHRIDDVTCLYRLHAENTLATGLPRDSRSRELYARTRLKWLNSEMFPRLRPDTQITFLYTLLLDPVHGMPTIRESVLSSARFEELPAGVRSKILYLAAVDHLEREGEPAIARSWLSRATSLSPYSLRYRASLWLTHHNTAALPAAVGLARQVRRSVRTVTWPRVTG